MQQINKQLTKATIFGYVALLFWVTSPVLVSHLKNIPTFEIISITFATSFIFTSFILCYKKQWHRVKQPWFLWVIGVLGIYGNDVLYIAAFKYAPPAQADLINYLWPILIVAFAGFLPREKFSIKHIIAAAIGFSGIFLLVTNGKGLAGFNSSYLLGYLLALSDAIVWSIYVLAARHYSDTPPEMIGMFCGIGMLLSILTHINLETTIAPSAYQLLVMLIMGMTVQSLAYFFWDYGVKKGRMKLLSILSYGNPVLSVLLLVFVGLAQPSISLALACILVSAGCILSAISMENIRLVKCKLISLFKNKEQSPSIET